MAIIRTGSFQEPGSFCLSWVLQEKDGCFWTFLHAGVHTPVSVFRLVDPKALFWTFLDLVSAGRVLMFKIEKPLSWTDQRRSWSPALRWLLLLRVGLFLLKLFCNHGFPGVTSVCEWTGVAGKLTLVDFPLRFSAVFSGTFAGTQFGTFGHLSDLPDPDTLRDQKEPPLALLQVPNASQ